MKSTEKAVEKSAEKPAPPATQVQQVPVIRYRHIQDAEGKIMVTIDLKTNEVEWNQSCEKKVAPAFFQTIDNLQGCSDQLRECGRQFMELKQSEAAKVPKKK